MRPLILVTGMNGQLGNELVKLSKQYTQFDYEFTDVAELDITNSELVNEFFDERKPAYCINAAAYTAVDKAETDTELALKINAEAVGILARNCAKVGAKFIHVSTDYVYDGTATSPYKEDQAVSPVNFYGVSKYEGEKIAYETLPSTITLRTSWVYSQFGNNFVKTMLRLMTDRESLNVVSDQVGSPTYAADLAAAIMQIVVQLDTTDQDYSGVYHFSNDGIISWYDFATEIRDLGRKSCTINPIPTSDYPTPAKRPAYSGMSKEKIITTFNIQLRDWKDSLKECIGLLNG
jgi:dTDP-4-dehydrorhamnose reductase